MSVEAEKEACAVNDLLHAFAPYKWLLSMGFVDADGNDFEADPDSFEEIHSIERIGLVTFALYYACSDVAVVLTREDPRHEIIQDIRIDAFVIRDLMKMCNAEAAGEAFSLSEQVYREKLSAKGRIAAKARHSNPNGKTQQRKERVEKLISLWQSNKYSTKDICAEQEWEGLGFESFRSARRALTNK